ncbi:MAG: imidazole glycerol phosphate synthase subunit HisH, partial [Bacillota bacterium]
MRIAIVDYGLGNLPNVQKALARAGAPEAAITSDPEIVAGADGVVLPGVGAFRAGMAGLRARGLVEPLRAVARSGRPLLGICLGAQLFLEASAEWGETEGLGLIPGRVEPLPAQPPAGRVRLPHIGWNWVAPRQPHPLFRDLGDGFWAYFAHSYAARPADPADIAAETEHGAPFVSAVARGSVAGVQFHPEKSGAAGLALLANWVAEVRRWAEFTLYPAIDLRGGRAVRLRQGRPDQATDYGDPVAAARRWLDQGARALHLVDLDGAFTGAAGSANAPAIAAIVAEARRRGVPVQLGGGLRTLEAIAAALDLGVSRVVVGSRALDEAFMAAALARFGPDRIVAGIDAREGRVATHGWLQVTEVSAVDLARRLYRLGVRHAVYTDVSRDGTLTGPDWAGLRAVA